MNVCFTPSLAQSQVIGATHNFNLDTIPRDPFRVILKFCSLSDEVSLSHSSKKLRILVQKTTTHLDVFKLIKDIPRTNLKDSKLDRLDSISFKIECIPGIGTPLSIVRCCSGIFLSIFFKAAKQVHRLQSVYSNDPAFRLAASTKILKDEINAVRSIGNIGYGAASIIPMCGLYKLVTIGDNIDAEIERRLAIRCLESLKAYSAWAEQLKKILLPIPESEEIIVDVNEFISEINNFTSVYGGDYLEDKLNQIQKESLSISFSINDRGYSHFIRPSRRIEKSAKKLAKKLSKFHLD